LEAQIQNAYRAYLNFNLAKKRESFKDFSEGQREAFVFIPYLLHTSEPKRLGYVDSMLAPCGIYGYKFSEEIKAIGKKYFSVKDRFEDPKNVANAPIESLSIMGSAGSIAQTEGSDLDYWVCIRDGLKPADRSLLESKLIVIEKWCMEVLNAEVHFFVSTAKDLRDNNFGAVNKESCGSALGKLLKEEYYRTSLHVMGKIPLWWLAPYNANDDTYITVPKYLGPSIGVEVKDFIDFGNSRHIPSDEFVGGGMWQLNKGVGSPFKSALKMALLVEYADDSQPRDLLAQMLKRRMLENPNDMDQLDPYRMMVERVLDYYVGNNNSEATYLIQRCLFIKMETKISRWWNSQKAPPHRTVRTLLEMVKSWNWNEREVDKWENFDILPMRELTEFKRKLETYMFTSLQALRSAGEKSKSRAVTAQDYKKMTQRLTTIFNPDPQRTEWFYSPYNKMIRFDVFSIQEEQQEHQSWRLKECL
jgi:adenylate cyclase, class 1